MAMKQAPMRNQQVELLNDLVRATRDGAAFYSTAAKKVGDPALSVLFDHLADSKKGLVGAIPSEVLDCDGEATASGRSGALLRELYDESLEAISQDQGDFGYIGELEKSEGQLMEAFRDVIRSDSTPRQVKQSVAGYLTTLRKHHDSLRNCRWALLARKSTH
jgi:uncharacterized protein (TIGR02284 family)